MTCMCKRKNWVKLFKPVSVSGMQCLWRNCHDLEDWRYRAPSSLTTYRCLSTPSYQLVLTTKLLITRDRHAHPLSACLSSAALLERHTIRNNFLSYAFFGDGFILTDGFFNLFLNTDRVASSAISVRLRFVSTHTLHLCTELALRLFSCSSALVYIHRWKARRPWAS